MRVVAIVNSGGGTVLRTGLDAATLHGMFQEAGVEADVRFVPGEQVGLLLLGLVRDLKTTEYVESRTLPGFTIETRERSTPVYLDGEVMVLETPLRYRTRSGALRVLLPRQ